MVIKRLYEMCIFVISKKEEIICKTGSLKFLPAHVLLEILHQLSISGQYYSLKKYFLDLEIFNRLLTQVKEEENCLHYIFQYLMDGDKRFGWILTEKYKISCQQLNSQDGIDEKSLARLLNLRIGLNIGSFLKESGWYDISSTILKVAIGLYHKHQMAVDTNIFKILFECNWNLLSVLASTGYFDEATSQMDKIKSLIEKFDLSKRVCRFNLSQVYAEYSYLFLLQGNFKESYEWAVEAIQHLTPQTPLLTLVDVYRQISKILVVRQDYKRGEIFINQAMIICKEIFGVTEEADHYAFRVLHLTLAKVFLDYGFYLLNVDSITQSIKLYSMALKIRKHIFCLKNNNFQNLLVALAYEELGNAWYAQEYGSGNFAQANFHVDKAMSILSSLVPCNRLLMAPIERIKALVMEEMALDNSDQIEKEHLLLHAREIHLAALDSARHYFGENNIRTARCYSYLGRLYQSMKCYKDAEAMHLKSIRIKQWVLGIDDYEVGLSLSHLASLYNYNLKLYEKAEKLYLRSIFISTKLFGDSYSGLGYDYRGLIRVYTRLENHEKRQNYSSILHVWEHSRENIAHNANNLAPIKGWTTMQKLPLHDILAIIKEN